MSLLRKLLPLQNGNYIKGTVLRSVHSYVLLNYGSYNLYTKPRVSHQWIKHKMCSTSSSQLRESFDEFRAREELKEKEALDQKLSGNTNKRQENEVDAKATKELILNAALGFVHTHGWSRQAISKGAESVNLPSVANGLFPRGGIELVQFHYRQSNEKLVEHLKENITATEKVIDPVTFAKKAIEFRLRMLIPYLKHWPQALGLMAIPPNVPTSLANVLTLVDDICYYAGDRSVDFNWYTRRIGLASIYKATELHMLQDSSVDFEKTWKFLDRRIEEASLVHDFLIKSDGATSYLQNAVGSAFSTARNILGLNFERR